MSKSKELQENYDRILRTFPDFPPFTMERFQSPLLSAFYELLNDNLYLYKLQQQSWLSCFHAENKEALRITTLSAKP